MPVTAGLARQHAGIVERSPQPRDLRLHRVPAYADGVGPPVIGEAIGAHLDAGPHRQAHEQLRGLPLRHRKWATEASEREDLG